MSSQTGYGELYASKTNEFPSNISNYKSNNNNLI